MKHTQGEWICKGNFKRIATNESLLDEVEICKISGDNSKLKIQANAKLIAAAPDLFKALAQIQFAVKSGAVTGLFKDEIECMNNAIEKATKP